MTTTAYRLEPVEVATKQLILEGSGQEVVWLVCLAFEVQEGRGRYVGTVFSVTLNRPVRVGKRGELRRVMDSEEEAYRWYEVTAGIREVA